MMTLEELELMLLDKPKKECTPPCIPRHMLGRSWWKRYGYNFCCSCAYKKLEQDSKNNK